MFTETLSHGLMHQTQLLSEGQPRREPILNPPFFMGSISLFFLLDLFSWVKSIRMQFGEQVK